MSHARDTRSARAATGGSGAKPGTSSFASPGRDAASSFGPYAGIRRVGGDHAAAAGSHGGAKADAQRQREFRFSFDEARGVSGAYPARTKGRATTAGPSRSTATHVRPTAIPRGAPDVDSPSPSPFPVNGSKPSVFSDSRFGFASAAQAVKSFEPSGMSRQTALGNRAPVPLTDANGSASSRGPARLSAFGSTIPASARSSSSATKTTNLASTPWNQTSAGDSLRRPGSSARPGSARPTSADLLHGRGATAMYEQLRASTSAQRPFSGRATGRAVATFTPTNRYVEDAAARSMRAAADEASNASISARSRAYRPPVVVSNVELRERGWNNPNSPATRVKTASRSTDGSKGGVGVGGVGGGPVSDRVGPVPSFARAPVDRSDVERRGAMSALEKLAISPPPSPVHEGATGLSVIPASTGLSPGAPLADIVAASRPVAASSTACAPDPVQPPIRRLVNYAVSAGIEPRVETGNLKPSKPDSPGSPPVERTAGKHRPRSAVARPVMDIGSVNERSQLPGYNLGKVVGEGGFCKVRLGVHQVTGAKTAVKLVDKAKLTEENDRRRVGREIRVLKRLAHEHVIRLFDVVDSPKIVYVVMEYADGGSLLDYVRRRKKLPEPEAARFFHQMCRGLDYCHGVGVVHRDVKLENVLLDAGENVKLIDFGLSAVLAGDGKKLKVHCGSPSYAAPEIVARRAYDGPPVDVWSSGVVLFAMVAGYLPFHAHGGNKQELCAKIQRGAFTVPDAATEDFRALIKSVLKVDPVRRATLRQCLDSPWIRAHVRSRDHDAGKAAPAHYPAAVSGADLDSARVESLTDAGLDRRRLVEHLRAADHNYYTAAYHLLAYRDTAAAGRDVNFEVEAAAAKQAAVAPAPAADVPRVFAPKPRLIPGHDTHPTVSKVAGITRAQTARSPRAVGRAAAPIAGGGGGGREVASARGVGPVTRGPGSSGNVTRGPGAAAASAVNVGSAGYARSTEAARMHRAATVIRPGSAAPGGQRRTVY